MEQRRGCAVPDAYRADAHEHGADKADRRATGRVHGADDEYPPVGVDAAVEQDAADHRHQRETQQ